MSDSSKAQTAEALRVLIISYLSPPMNVISSFRLEGFANHLPDNGIDTTVLTMLWDPEPNGDMAWHPKGTPVLEEYWGKTRVFRVPRTSTSLQRFLDHSLKVPVWSSIVVLVCYCLGIFNIHITFSHTRFKRFLREHLKGTNYDVVIATSPPEEHIALGAWVRARFGIPFVADYRDVYDTRPLMKDKERSVRERVQLAFKHYYHRRWARNIDRIMTISRPMGDLLSGTLGVPDPLEIRNGYLPHKMRTERSGIRSDKFCITYAGRIYPWQDVGPFIQAFNLFMAGLSPEEQELVDLSLYGCQDQDQASKLEQGIGTPFTLQLRRVPQDTIYKRIAESSVLLVFDIGLTGGYTGKLMDYSGTFRNVLLIPSDEGVMAELVRTSGIGLATSEPLDAAAQLATWFRQWQTSGHPEFLGNPGIIRQGSRAEQTALLAKELKRSFTPAGK